MIQWRSPNTPVRIIDGRRIERREHDLPHGLIAAVLLLAAFGVTWLARFGHLEPRKHGQRYQQGRWDNAGGVNEVQEIAFDTFAGGGEPLERIVIS